MSLRVSSSTKYEGRLFRVGFAGSQPRSFGTLAGVLRQRSTASQRGHRKLKSGSGESAASPSSARKLLSPYGHALQGPSHGPQGFFPEPLDAWLAVLADSVPFYKDCLVICRSTVSKVQARDVWDRCRQHIPAAHVGALTPRKYMAGKATDAAATRDFLALPSTNSTGRAGGVSPVTPPPALQVPRRDGVSNHLTSASTAQMPSLYSPLEDVPPGSLDLVVLPSNVFALEMLFDAPWHLSLAHRALRPHGVIAIFGHAAEAEVAAPEWAATDTNDYIASTHLDARDALQLAAREVCTGDEYPHHLRRTVEVHETLRTAHNDVFFPFPSVRRRWFTSEYALWPHQLAAYYRSDPLYQALYGPTGSLWWKKMRFTAEALQRQRMAASSSWGDNEDFFVDVPGASLDGADSQGQGIERSLDDLVAAWSPLGVRRRRSARDPLDVLQALLNLHAAALKLPVTEPPLRVRLNHFVVTCSTRSINAALSSEGRAGMHSSQLSAPGKGTVLPHLQAKHRGREGVCDT
ncbi:hypothetical protein JKF63_01221 [Porcisia hertigi]|uniref:Uncharacterized protein n=1 Tax=Porcisia hertigi TaxID=2761500 RepID=A0A836H2U2_9TRYP|nr:hypothetical protein JKF63_01221 [Porcisia hertigi]